MRRRAAKSYHAANQGRNAAVSCGMRHVPLLASRPARWVAACVLSGLLAACNLHLGTGIEVHDTWTRSYTVKPGVVLEIHETSGLVHVDAGDGDAIVVNATRFTKAPTEEAAKAKLAGFTIAETVTDERVMLDGTGQGASPVADDSRRVDYRITVPRSAAVTIRSVASEIRVTGIAGVLHVESVNGRIAGTGLGSGADVRIVNGTVRLDFGTFGGSGVRCKMTNGELVVTVPADTKATIAASIVNGEIHTEKLSVAVREQTGRSLTGTIGGGGPDIRLEMVNGDVRIVGKP